MNNNDVNPNNTSNPVVSSSTANIPVVDPNTTSVPVVDPNMNTATIPTVDPNTASLPVVNPLEVKVTNEVEENPTPVVSTPEPTAVSTPPVIPTDSNSSTTQPVAEPLKKVEVEYTPPSKAKLVLLVVFFIGLVAFVLFLPEINSMVLRYKAGNLNDKPEEITTGRLICSLHTSTKNLDKNYDLVFHFTDNKLEKTEFKITTKGDPSEDAEVLDGLNEACQQLKNNVSDLSGVTIGCDYSEGKLIERQSYDLANVDQEALDSAFSEAGGNNPEYKNGQDMSYIEKNMNASNYSCERQK